MRILISQINLINMKTVLTKLIERIDMLSEGLDATSDETKIHLIGIKKTAESMLADEKIPMHERLCKWMGIYEKESS